MPPIKPPSPSLAKALFFTVFLAQYFGGTTAMHAAEPSKPARTVTVSAKGRVQAAPDMARVSTGVVAEAKTAKEALAKNSEAMRRVVDGLKQAGIAAKDIQTTSFEIQPRHRHHKDGRPPEIVGYQVHNQVRIVARDLPKLGEVLDRIVTLGTNQVGGIDFQVSGQEKLADEARKQAMANALRRAKLYAEAAGAEVGRVLTISEEVRHHGGSRPVAMARAAMATEAAPIEPGTETLEVSVLVTWELR